MNEVQVIEKFDVTTFRELTKKVIAAEKPGFWSDWTKDQQEIYMSGNWEAFSRSRGYSEDEISDFRLWIEMLENGKMQGYSPLEIIKDLSLSAALNNMSLDKNNEILKSSHIPSNRNIPYREKVVALETEMRKLPGVMTGDYFPLKHTFADGCYVREMFAPKGHLIVTKIHKKTHPYFVLKGDCSVLTENGVRRIKAPFSGITLAGTKRVVYVHEDTVWITVHVTNETDLDKIEEEVIAKTFSELPNNIIETLGEVLKLEEK